MSRLCLALLVLLTPALAVPTATAGDGASDRRARAHRTRSSCEWNEVTLEAIRRVQPGPPITARALAVVSTCVYDAWAAYDRKALATETGGTLRRPPHERTYRNKHEAVSVSAHMALVDLFPGERALFDEALLEQGYEPGAPAGVESPAGVARAACGAVLAFRHADGSNQLGDENNGTPYSDYTGYDPVNTVDVVDGSQSLAADHVLHRRHARVHRPALGPRHAVRARGGRRPAARPAGVSSEGRGLYACKPRRCCASAPTSPTARR